MTDLTALIVAAREWEANPASWGDNGLVTRLADALEEAHEVLAGADHTAAKYWRRMVDAEREMHARELHHFEEEQKSAGLAAVIERVRANLSNAPECDEHPDGGPITCGWKADMVHVRAALNTAPADALTDLKRDTEIALLERLELEYKHWLNTGSDTPGVLWLRAKANELRKDAS